LEFRTVKVDEKANEVRIVFPAVSEMAWQRYGLPFYFVAIGLCVIPIFFGLPQSFFCLFDVCDNIEKLYCVFLIFFYGGGALWAYLGFVRQFLVKRTLILKPQTLILTEKELGFERLIFEIPKTDLHPLKRELKHRHDQSTPGTSPYKLLLVWGQKQFEIISDYPEHKINMVQSLYDGYRVGYDLDVVVKTFRQATGPFCWIGKGKSYKREMSETKPEIQKGSWYVRIYRARQIGTAIFIIGIGLWFGLWKLGGFIQMIGPILCLIAGVWLFHMMHCAECRTILSHNLGFSKNIICQNCGTEIGDKVQAAIPTPKERKVWLVILGLPLLVVLGMLMIAIIALLQQ